MNLAAYGLRKWRGERTQMEAAAILEMDQSKYSKLERGARKPGRQLSVVIRDRTGIPVDHWDHPAPVEQVAANG